MSSKDAPSLVINRTLNAPVEIAYQAWAGTTKIIRWFGPSDEMTGETPDFDFRVGGRYTLLLLSPTGDRHCVSGEYKEIIENQKLVFSWAWETTPARVSQVTVTFRPDGDTTRLQLMHEQVVSDEVRDNHNRGWVPSLDRLVANISTL